MSPFLHLESKVDHFYLLFPKSCEDQIMSAFDGQHFKFPSPSGIPERIEGVHRAWGQGKWQRQSGEVPLKGDTPFALPWLQLCLSPNHFCCQPGLIIPVFSLPTANLGQIFSTRFTFYLFSSFQSSPFCFLFCYKMGLPWKITVLRLATKWWFKNGFIHHSFLHSFNQPTNPTWMLQAPVLTLLGTQPCVKYKKLPV